MSEVRKATQTERVHLILKQAGAFWTSAQAITEATGITRVAARIHDLRAAGVGIESKFINREAGKSYRLTSVERANPTDTSEPENFDGHLFDDTPAPINAIYGEEAA